MNNTISISPASQKRQNALYGILVSFAHSHKQKIKIALKPSTSIQDNTQKQYTTFSEIASIDICITNITVWLMPDYACYGNSPNTPSQNFLKIKKFKSPISIKFENVPNSKRKKIYFIIMNMKIIFSFFSPAKKIKNRKMFHSAKLQLLLENTSFGFDFLKF
jgi:hypothetical protein